ncbi:MAG: immunoglobulin domain-containing protein [Defluviitaleaceae bacterium]|nr:immunoglobulin domain-containing protein [Defluviitaleaceae bacterium]MCL2836291.1 immunoglobulin domain-containing protein [Defluviitaleaceae bacterium]
MINIAKLRIWLVAVLLSAAIVVVISPVEVFAAAFGENLTWAFGGGVLTITQTGTGPGVMEWTGNPPWFSNRANITSVNFVGNITNIGSGAFIEATSLQSITIPSTVTSIDGGAFAGSGLQSINIPDSVTSIGPGAFRNTLSLGMVVIGENVNNIGHEAFHYASSAAATRIVIFKGDRPSTLGSFIFHNSHSSSIIYYYENKARWNDPLLPTNAWGSPSPSVRRLSARLTRIFWETITTTGDNDGRSTTAPLQAGITVGNLTTEIRREDIFTVGSDPTVVMYTDAGFSNSVTTFNLAEGPNSLYIKVSHTEDSNVFLYYHITVTRTPRTITVGAQAGTLTVNQSGTVTFPIQTTAIAQGSYTVTITPSLPTGVSVQGNVSINSAGVGTLTLNGNGTFMSADDTTKHTLTFNTVSGVTSNKFKVTVSPAPTFGISASPSPMDFGSVEEGYAVPPATQMLTVTNTGTGAVTLLPHLPVNFNIGTLDRNPVTAVNPTSTLTIRPKPGLTPGNYNETLTISGNSGAVSTTVDLQFSVTAGPTYLISASPSPVQFGSVEADSATAPYTYTQPAEVTVTITNVGSEEITLVQPTSTNYMIGALSTTSLPSTDSTATFTIRPRSDLLIGNRNETITISGSNGATAQVQANFSIIPPLTYSVEVNPDPAQPISFGALGRPYTQPAARTVTIKNTGTGSITLTPPAPNSIFDITPLSTTNLAATNAQATFTIRPKAGLDDGNYSEEITVSGTNIPDVVLTVTFNVIITPPSITTQPANQSAVPGGNATFTVIAAGTPTLTYQWQDSADGGTTWNDIYDAKNASFTVSGATPSMDGSQYRCIIENDAGKIVSSAAVLTVSEAPVAPTITGPAAMSLAVGYEATNTSAFTLTGIPAPVVAGNTNHGNRIVWNAEDKWLDIGEGLPTGTYAVVLTAGNGVPPNSTHTFTLTVSAAPAEPAFTTHPLNRTVAPGENASFTATAAGNPAPTYQWQVNSGSGWSDIPGATGTTLTLQSVAESLSGNQYRCVASNNLGKAESNAATLTVSTTGGPGGPDPTVPVITSHPLNVSTDPGRSATFSIEAVGSPAPVFQWQVNTGSGWSNISGARNTTLTVRSVTASDDGNRYRCVVTNNHGSVTSNEAWLAVSGEDGTAPSIISHPFNQNVMVGQSATFTVMANGIPAPSYQWQVNNGSGWSNIARATSDTLTVSNVRLSDSGNRYRCVVRNSEGTDTSDSAALSVYEPATPTPVHTPFPTPTLTPGHHTTGFYTPRPTPEPTLPPAITPSPADGAFVSGNRQRGTQQGVLGFVTHTDIQATVNGHAMPTYNAYGRPAVAVEDLANYGFDVFWDGDNMTLSVERSPHKTITPLSWNRYAVPAGEFKSNYYSTRIQTYLSGEAVRCFVIDGQTLIDFELLEKYGTVTWNNEARELRLVLD